VASTAVNGGVGARQWEAVVVLFYILDRNLPSANRVALRAIRAQLALVNISMAVLALLTDVREDHFDVALGAGDGRVHAAQRIARLVMIELGNGADRPPAIRGVTVLARDSQTAVRTVARSGALRTRSAQESREHKYQNENYFESGPDPSAHALPLACVL
jgi:hypothetical protein